MKLAPMSYHYVRYPIEKFLDKVERSPFDSIDLYCSAPQLNMFDYPVSRLLELDKSIRRHHLSVMAMTPENCVYPVNFCTQDTLTRESSIRYYQRAIDTAPVFGAPAIQISTGFGYFDMPLRGSLEILPGECGDSGCLRRAQGGYSVAGGVEGNHY